MDYTGGGPRLKIIFPFIRVYLPFVAIHSRTRSSRYFIDRIHVGTRALNLRSLFVRTTHVLSCLCTCIRADGTGEGIGKKKKKKGKKSERENAGNRYYITTCAYYCNSWKSVKCFGPLFTSSSWCTAVQVHFFDSPVKNVLFCAPSRHCSFAYLIIVSYRWRDRFHGKNSKNSS